MDMTFTRSHNGYEIELVVEDDIITSANVYMGDRCEKVYDIVDGEGREIPYTRKNLNGVYRMVCGDLNPEPMTASSSAGRQK